MHMGWRTIGSCSRGRSIADVQMTDASTEVVGSLKLTFFFVSGLADARTEYDSANVQCILAIEPIKPSLAGWSRWRFTRSPRALDRCLNKITEIHYNPS